MAWNLALFEAFTTTKMMTPESVGISRQ